MAKAAAEANTDRSEPEVGPELGVRGRRREATRQAILDSALGVFSEQGFEGATTRDIAGRAGVNHAMIQYYFQSKDELWKAAVDFLFARLGREVSLDPARVDREFGGDVRAFARAAIGEYVRYCAHHPEHARLMIQESVRAGERLDWLTRTYGRGNKSAARRFLSLLQAEGLLPPGVSLPALTYIVVGASQLFFALAPEVRGSWRVDPESEPQIQAHIEAVLAVLLR